ncbi:hypothetical protein [Nostoc sp.]|uniref:hypothetical protein n=1 Tax=Nostoc sp. TaxID=1180 RepID=UPI002FFB3CEC
MAINDWHYFLNHIIENPSHPDANYRIFETKWREVIILWLGRENIEINSKERFINELVEFEDSCENFYGYRALFLVCNGVEELSESNLKGLLINVMETPIDEIKDSRFSRKI